MAHFAQLDENNIVIGVTVVSNEVLDNLNFPESESLGIEFCKSFYTEDTKWKQTSYNGNFRVRYAGIGYKYDEVLDAFIPPKPFPSWIFDESTLSWKSQVPRPEGDLENKRYYWDENLLTWVPILL